MLQKLFSAACCVALCLGLALNAQASLFTSNGDWGLVSAEDGAAPISDVKILSGSGAAGRIYTNQTSGLPFARGAGIRMVSAYAISEAQGGIHHTGVKFADGDVLVFVSALQGSITSVGVVQTTRFAAGRAFALKFNVGTFDSRDPSTWGAGTLVAEYALKRQEDIFSGDPLGTDISIAGELTNQSSISSVAIPLTQSLFLFREQSSAGLTPGDNLLSNVDASVVPPGLVLRAESLIADIDQTLLFSDFEAFDTVALADGIQPLDAADLALLNAVAGAAGLGDLSGAGTAFATGVGGTGLTDFNPQFPPAPLDGPTGDFFATLGVDNYTAIQTVVPEPSSMVLFTLGAGGLGLYRRIRRSKKA
jgi:PEP-CTERM motif